MGAKIKHKSFWKAILQGLVVILGFGELIWLLISADYLASARLFENLPFWAWENGGLIIFFMLIFTALVYLTIVYLIPELKSLWNKD